MKTVGERIRQAREHRGLSGEELAKKVGYKTQSGISNLENRASGHGGEKLTKIAEALNFSVEWFLNGPDTEDMASVKPFFSFKPANAPIPLHTEDRIGPDWSTPTGRAKHLLGKINDDGLTRAIEYLEMLAIKYPRNGNGAGDHVPARHATL